MSAALNHLSPTTTVATAATVPTRRRTWRYVGLGLMLASIAVAAAVLPFVWNFLDAINALPKMAWLQTLLAGMPAASWVLMLVWGTAVPVALMVAFSRPGQVLPSVLLIAALTLWAVTWYVHMPAASQCTGLYPDSSLCGVLQWTFSLSLGLATSIYIFAIFLLAVSSLCMLTDDGSSDSAK
jgi:hypothetical protein